MAEERGISEIHLEYISTPLSNGNSRSNGNHEACIGAEAVLDEAPPLQTNSLDLKEGKITNTGQNPEYDGPTMHNINGSENVMPKSIDDTIISDHNSGTRTGAGRNGSSYNLDDVTKAEHLARTRPGAHKNGSSYNLDDVTNVKWLATSGKDVNKTDVTKTKLKMCVKQILPDTLPNQTTNSDNNLNTSLDGATPDGVNIPQNLFTPQASSPENNRKNTRVKNLSKDSIDYLNDRLSFGCSSPSWENIAHYKGWNYEQIKIHSQKCTSHRFNPFEELIMHKDFADYRVYQLLEDLERIPRIDLFNDFDQYW